MRAGRGSACTQPILNMTNLDKIGTSAGPFSLTVDYDISLADMVAAGDYHYIYPLIIEEHFPVGWGERDIESFLVHLHSPTSSDNIVTELERHDLRPATLPELLAFGAQQSPQGQFPILALGSTWNDPEDHRRAVRILGNPGDRRLDLVWDHGVEWYQLYRFLAIQKQVCETLPLVVDKNKSFAERIESGDYLVIGRGIPKVIPDAAKGVEETEAVLVHLAHVMDNADVLRELDRRGLRPGTIHELAAVGEQYLDWQLDFPILALGSVVQHRRVGCLWPHRDRRAFYLNAYRDRWAASYRFLAFKTHAPRNDRSSRKCENRPVFRPLDATLDWIDG
jgi:hypothetical protein